MNRPSWFPVLLKISLFTGLIVILITLMEYLWGALVSKWAWGMIAFFYFFTLGGIILIVGKTSRNTDSFAKYFFIVMISRLLLATLFVAAGLYFGAENRVIFVSNFLVLYLFYLGFEIYYLITIFQSRTGL